MLKPPVFGELFHKVGLARVTNTLGSLIGSGVPILEALDISAETAGNVDHRCRAAGGQAGRVREGRPAGGSPSRSTRTSSPLSWSR